MTRGKQSNDKLDHVVTLGPIDRDTAHVVEAAAQAAGAGIARVAQIDQIGAWLGRGHVAIVLPMERRSSSADAVTIRMRYPNRAVPIIGVARQIDDLLLAEAFGGGVDDVCSANVRCLSRRLRHLAEAGPLAVDQRDGRVVIADSDPRLRVLIARVFREAGFAVEFAADGEEVLARSSAEDVEVVVCNAALDTRAEPLCERARRAGSTAAWIVSTPPRRIPEMRARMAARSLSDVMVHDSFASPATLLFVANDMLNRRAAEGRASERLIYGTRVRFRRAGRDDPDDGYLYNISEAGLYVRTLAPLAADEEIWVELIPPRCDRLVHLEAKVVWRRGYGARGAATVPFGFGAAITAATNRDMLRYVAGYQRLLTEQSARPITAAAS